MFVSSYKFLSPFNFLVVLIYMEIPELDNLYLLDTKTFFWT